MALALLHTERLILRPFEMTDAPAVCELAGDPEVASTTLSIPHPYPPEAAEQFITFTREQMAKGIHYVFAITRKQDGLLLGAISLHSADHPFRRAELAYWVGRPYWGQGYAPEAARAVVRFAFADLGLNKVWAAHMTRNPASGKVMQKVGMTYEGTRRQDIIKWDRFEDIALYSILRSEWTAS